MKRSEIVEKLHAKMLEFGFCTINAYMDSDVEEYDASNILDFLEKEGMLPPKSTPKYHHTGKQLETKYEWDEE